MKLKFKDDYPLEKIDICQGEFRRVFERKDQPFDVPDHLGETILRTTYPYRIDNPGGKVGKVGFEDRLAFEQVVEEPKAEKKSKGV